MQQKVIIGCPVHNDKESLMAMVESLINSTTAFYKCFFIESESTDGADIFLDELSSKDNRFQVAHTKLEGPLKAYNDLFELAKQEKADLLLTQTDVLFTKLYKKDWLEWFKRVSKIEDIGAIIPLNGGGISGQDYINGFEWLGGWCTYIPYRTIEKGIKFDEKFPKSEYGVDIDLTMQIHKAQLRIGKIDYWVHHHMQNTREHDNHPDTEKHKQECAKYFRKKWKVGEFKDT